MTGRATHTRIREHTLRIPGLFALHYVSKPHGRALGIAVRIGRDRTRHWTKGWRLP